ncbi:hypothetical protein [Ammoniphilus sp. 3BR4]|uniref:hypothetical protein n=1 Tax=Ammoniphilus sp. 3BR4 TaxID=3158265 RepID=UPI0034667C92
MKFIYLLFSLFILVGCSGSKETLNTHFKQTWQLEKMGLILEPTNDEPKITEEEAIEIAIAKGGQCKGCPVPFIEHHSVTLKGNHWESEVTKPIENVPSYIISFTPMKPKNDPKLYPPIERCVIFDSTSGELIGKFMYAVDLEKPVKK